MRLFKSFLVPLSFILAFSMSALAADAPAVNINTADVSQLVSLNGIGQSKAEAIIAYRSSYGPFQSVDELTAVKGIGESLVNKNRDQIVLESASLQ